MRAMKLMDLKKWVDEQVARLAKDSLSAEGWVIECAVEMGGTTRVAPLRQCAIVGNAMRLTGRPA